MTREIIEVTRGTQVVQDACTIMSVNVWGMGQIVSFGLVMEPLNPLPIPLGLFQTSREARG